jgi:deazaflavin-dependent oxidoreductase (nitroreductase family)
MRLPIYLNHLDLGWLLGHRFLLVTHRGRRTGLLRQTVVEVIHYDPATRESVVLSALGDRADWYRNIQASPPLEVQTGRLRYVPQHRILPPEEAHAVWMAFERAHLIEARLADTVLGWPYDRTPVGRWELAQAIRLVAFRPMPGDASTSA